MHLTRDLLEIQQFYLRSKRFSLMAVLASFLAQSTDDYDIYIYIQVVSESIESIESY